MKNKKGRSVFEETETYRVYDKLEKKYVGAFPKNRPGINAALKQIEKEKDRDNFQIHHFKGDKKVDIVKEMKREELKEIVRECILELNEQEKWIQKAIKRKGALRKKMGVKKGEKIPPEKLTKTITTLAKKGEGPKTMTKPELQTFKQAVLAKTLKKLKK